MGFEMKFQYHDRLAEGFGYNKDEVKEMKRKLGDPLEDVPLDKLAGVIFAQYARRDIMVVGVAVEEITRKSVSFKETKGGIVLKNKKFLLDEDANHIVVQEVTAVMVPVQANVNLAQPARANVNLAQSPRSVRGGQGRKKQVVFMPSETTAVRELFRQTGARLTPEKEYPVLSEQMNASGIGMTFTITDDVGREHTVPDEFFVQADITLLADQQLGFSRTNGTRDTSNLSWAGAVSDNIPNIRGR